MLTKYYKWSLMNDEFNTRIDYLWDRLCVSYGSCRNTLYRRNTNHRQTENPTFQQVLRNNNGCFQNNTKTKSYCSRKPTSRKKKVTFKSYLFCLIRKNFHN